MSLDILRKLDEKKRIGGHRSPSLYKFNKRANTDALKNRVTFGFWCKVNNEWSAARETLLLTTDNSLLTNKRHVTPDTTLATNKRMVRWLN